jgi:penicillin-binding protein 2
MGNMAEGLKDPRSPFLDRVYKGAYPPGSVFKIITAIAGFEKDALNTSEKINCIGYEVIQDKRNQERRYKCWKKHGYVDYWRAMAESCDSYFYLLGKKLGSQPIYEIGQMFGFGQTAQTMMTGENKGVLPNPTWKKRVGQGGWSLGDTYNMAIGQGFVTATPLQICVLMTGIATRGVMYHPYVVRTIEDANKKAIFKSETSPWKTVTLKDSTWDSLNKSLENVVTHGTGQASRIENLEVHGKTGTAQNPHGEDHAWFAGYAGYKGEKPSVAVCVFVENGGHGGAVAAPIVRRMLEVALPPKTEGSVPSPFAKATGAKP